MIWRLVPLQAITHTVPMERGAVCPLDVGICGENSRHSCGCYDNRHPLTVRMELTWGLLKKSCRKYLIKKIIVGVLCDVFTYQCKGILLICLELFVVNENCKLHPSFQTPACTRVYSSYITRPGFLPGNNHF